MPSSQVEGQLRELRCHYGRDLYRILYQRSEDLFVLLHIVEKRSRTLARTDIEIAKERWGRFPDANERTRSKAAESRRSRRALAIVSLAAVNSRS